MEDCLFCKIVRGEIPSWKVYEDEYTFAFFDINPKNEYHTLVITKNHYRSVFDTPEDELVYVMKTVKKIVSLYSDKIGLTDVQIINNSGENAQQEVPHLHFHIVPRYAGDGQNCRYPATRTELSERFEQMLEKVKTT